MAGYLLLPFRGLVPGRIDQHVHEDGDPDIHPHELRDLYQYSDDLGDAHGDLDADFYSDEHGHIERDRDTL